MQHTPASRQPLSSRCLGALRMGLGHDRIAWSTHLSHLLETEQCLRKVSFWYGARSKQEIFYQDYFQNLEQKYRNFAFNLALSSPLPEDAWTGYLGFIHEVVLQQYLCRHESPCSAEYYLCGPPMMIEACLKMLSDLGVPSNQIAHDEF